MASFGPTTPIKAYRATFTRGEDDYVASGLPEGEHHPAPLVATVFAPIVSQQQTGDPRTISAIAAAFPRTPMVVALSADYLKAVTPDLEGVLARPYFRDHLVNRLVWNAPGSSIWKGQSAPLRCLIGRTRLGGALTSLNARVARRLFQNLNRREPYGRQHWQNW